jgi:hypothetical protein
MGSNGVKEREGVSKCPGHHWNLSGLWWKNKSRVIPRSRRVLFSLKKFSLWAGNLGWVLTCDSTGYFSLLSGTSDLVSTPWTLA